MELQEARKSARQAQENATRAYALAQKAFIISAVLAFAAVVIGGAQLWRAGDVALLRLDPDQVERLASEHPDTIKLDEEQLGQLIDAVVSERATAPGE